MYLKSIKSHGFKSFADVIELDLKEGITGVVGPNGSGKSNIVDAVKWVLGEQSLKALRGTNNMSDIIFAGSKTRNPMTRAYVALTFDNSDHYLNTEFDTVEIKRILYKTGENDYFINNNKVRLKDITDLFIDSGAGKESFNIISQGSVSDIVNSKAEDRRSIFESAAGVLKYKKRKEETNRKLVRVQDNLEKIQLVIDELQDNRDILEKQAKDARIYLDNKKELENIEIALIAQEITSYSSEYNELKKDIDNLKEEIDKDSINSSKEIGEIEKLKLENIKLEEKINDLQEKIITINSSIAKLNSQKQIVTERKKYTISEDSIENNVINLKEEELTISKNINGVKTDIKLLNEDIDSLKKSYQAMYNTYQAHNLDKNRLESSIDKLNKEQLSLKNQIEILQDNIDNDTKMPISIKNVLNSPKLTGIHGTIGKLIKIDDKYALAIDTALGYSSNVIVVDNENRAKDAINYLKDNNYGRATFFPLNIIKSRYIDGDTLSNLESMEGFINVASNLVDFDSKYKNIIENQLGNVIVVDNIDSLNSIGKKLNYKYRIVTLDGQILHTGGALSGGSSKQNSNSIIMLKQKLKELDHKLKLNQEELDKLNKEYNDMNKVVQEESSNLISNKNKINEQLESLNRKNIVLSDLNNSYEVKHNELVGLTNLKGDKIDDELDKLLSDYYKEVEKKENTEKELKKYKDEKNKVFLQINDLEKLNKNNNSSYSKKVQTLKTKEIRAGKLDVLLDNLLNTLNETYNMTYEKAESNYKLEIPVSEAQSKIHKLKQVINSIGNVNTGSIDEFERVNTRYNFLVSQREDLQKSIDSLNQAINEMDEIMKDRFLKTFNEIQKEFDLVFKKLFKGGYGKLELTDPEDLLNTGIDIVAQPPGKKLNSIGLLSGGEKTLTAISLLFAILNVKTVPFVILDEVEAALDEANVETFGKYLIEKKDKSQFIIITHKKKTMEYADCLYGITMQESGISKLVSVKLENL